MIRKIINFIKNGPFPDDPNPKLKVRDNARVFDRSKNAWGSHVEWDDFQNFKIWGHYTPLPEVGDLFDSQMKSGETARFVITKIERAKQVHDMFFGEVQFLEYLA